MINNIGTLEAIKGVFIQANKNQCFVSGFKIFLDYVLFMLKFDLQKKI